MSSCLIRMLAARPMPRRSFFKHATAATLPLVFGGRLLGQAAQVQPALIARSQNPDNLEFPFTTLNSFITPNNLFYVRNHFAAPQINANNWRLRIGGAVQNELTLSLEDLRALPSRSVTATLECAGNSRALVQPALRGVGWQLGAVSNAEWTGVPLAAVLDRAGVRAAAIEVVLQGADRGTVAAEPGLGAIHFARSLPVAKARQQDVLLAYRMNGADLPSNHGFPVRLVVPDWYGMASVKWLQRITLAERPFGGFFQTLDYTIFERQNGEPQLVPITQMQVKALIAQPVAGQVLAPNTPVRIHGAAWTGESQIARVEVNTDGSRRWQEARLLGQVVAHAWRLWEFPWRTPAQAGRVTLRARAIDGRPHVQPLTRDADRRNYVVNHVLPVGVEVR
jgi:DMSO/TMAO reductase YedYZ molybdopterin-dependent catalytic subunit